MEYYGSRMKTVRILVNTPASLVSPGQHSLWTPAPPARARQRPLRDRL